MKQRSNRHAQVTSGFSGNDPPVCHYSTVNRHIDHHMRKQKVVMSFNVVSPDPSPRRFVNKGPIFQIPKMSSFRVVLWEGVEHQVQQTPLALQNNNKRQPQYSIKQETRAKRILKFTAYRIILEFLVNGSRRPFHRVSELVSERSQ